MYHCNCYVPFAFGYKYILCYMYTTITYIYIILSHKAVKLFKPIVIQNENNQLE